MTDEDKLKRKCVGWLKKFETKDVWFYCPTDHFYSGIPDIIMCIKGFFVFIELKTSIGKVSKIQDWTHGRLWSAGARGMVCRSFDEFKDFVTRRHHG